MSEQKYEIEPSPEELLNFREEEIRRGRAEKIKDEQPMGDVYDVLAKAVSVHSKLSNMSEDYTLTRYDEDIYNMKVPKFVREQRKLLRVVKSYIVIPKSILRSFFNTQSKIDEIHEGLIKEYKVIEKLLLGELDETVIMGRTPKGEVIKALLRHGMTHAENQEHDGEIEKPTIGQKMNERNK